jgi:hypothetical protein
MTPPQAIRATQVTTRFHLTHGAPVHLGDPAEIGIYDLTNPEFGDPVTVHPGEIPVFWSCGVTSQLAATSALLPRVITHAPGHMFVSDLKDEDLTILGIIETSSMMLVFCCLWSVVGYCLIEKDFFCRLGRAQR